MPTRSSKPPTDMNQLAWHIVQAATQEDQPPAEPVPEKNPAAVALGRLGGQKGGKARAERLSPERRREIAQQAAASRWKDNDDKKTT